MCSKTAFVCKTCNRKTRGSAYSTCRSKWYWPTILLKRCSTFAVKRNANFNCSACHRKEKKQGKEKLLGDKKKGGNGDEDGKREEQWTDDDNETLHEVQGVNVV